MVSKVAPQQENRQLDDPFGEDAKGTIWHNNKYDFYIKVKEYIINERDGKTVLMCQVLGNPTTKPVTLEELSKDDKWVYVEGDCDYFG